MSLMFSIHSTKNQNSMELDSKENKYLRAKEQVAEIKKFYTSLLFYVIFIAFLGGLNYYTNQWRYMWFLWAAFGWGISIYGVFASWESAVVELKGLGCIDIPHDPMLDYWLRMAAGAFTGIGLFLLILACKPVQFPNVIPIVGALLAFEGIVLLVHGIRLNLEPLPFYVDVAFCLSTGIGIWLLRNEVKKA